MKWGATTHGGLRARLLVAENSRAWVTTSQGASLWLPSLAPGRAGAEISARIFTWRTGDATTSSTFIGGYKCDRLIYVTDTTANDSGSVLGFRADAHGNVRPAVRLLGVKDWTRAQSGGA